MICFHFSIFEPLETAQQERVSLQVWVVICFHFSITEPLETAQQGTVSLQVWVGCFFFQYL